jgi:hypothetical protein
MNYTSNEEYVGTKTLVLALDRNFRELALADNELCYRRISGLTCSRLFCLAPQFLDAHK